MHRQSIATLVYRHLFPCPRPTDPNSFPSHLTRNLVPEVRAETSTFYGTLDCIEARYPGLDYTHPPHRMRLSRFTHHRRLFRAFDELGLTKDEILGLCRWEGTRWARESYERQENIKVRDTTGDEIPEWTPRVKQEPSKLASDGLEVDTEELDDELQEGSTVNGDEEESEEEIESVGIELNQRLSAAAEARERGADVVMDEAWEQWLKEASERGTLTDSINALRAGQTLPPIGMPLNPSTIPRPTTAPTTTSTAAGTALS